MGVAGMIARAATPEERQALAEAVGIAITPETRGVVAVDSANTVRGGVLYCGWTENAVQCHMATGTPLAWRALLPAVFRYPFEEAKRGVLLGYIRASNGASLKMAKHLGFMEVHRVKDGFAVGDDLVQIEMRREDCRHLRVRRPDVCAELGHHFGPYPHMLNDHCARCGAKRTMRKAA